MNKFLKKTIICICYISILSLTGCSDENSNDNTEKIEVTTDDITSTSGNKIDNISLDTDFYDSWGYFENTYRKVDGEYGSLRVPFEYKGEDVVLGKVVEPQFTKKEQLLNMNINVYVMVLVDNEFVEFSVNDSQKSLMQKVIVKNGEETFFDISFTPYGLSVQSEMVAKILVLYQPERYEINEAGRELTDDYLFSTLSTNASIVSEEISVPKQEDIPYDTDYIKTKVDPITRDNEDISYLWGNNILCFGGNPNEDFIIQREDGNYEFMARRENWHENDYDGEVHRDCRSVIICDGELYNGFDGKYIFKWETDEACTIRKKIDISNLEKGEHEIFVVTFDNIGNEAYRTQYTKITVE